MSLTSDNNVRYGLVYKENIYTMLSKFGKFTMKDCDECRKACCKCDLVAIDNFKYQFVKQFEADAEVRVNDGYSGLNPEKMFDILAEAFKHAHEASHALANFLVASSDLKPELKYPLPTEIGSSLSE